MHVTESTDTHLVLEEVAWRKPALLLAGCLYLFWFAVSARPELPLFYLSGALLLGLFAVLSARRVAVRFDAQSGRVDQVIRRLFMYREYAAQMKHINKVRVRVLHKGRARGGEARSVLYRVQLELEDGSVLPLSPVFQGGFSHHHEIAELVREFLLAHGYALEDKSAEEMVKEMRILEAINHLQAEEGVSKTEATRRVKNMQRTLEGEARMQPDAKKLVFEGKLNQAVALIMKEQAVPRREARRIVMGLIRKHKRGNTAKG